MYPNRKPWHMVLCMQDYGALVPFHKVSFSFFPLYFIIILMKQHHESKTSQRQGCIWDAPLRHSRILSSHGAYFDSHCVISCAKKACMAHLEQTTAQISKLLEAFSSFWPFLPGCRPSRLEKSYIFTIILSDYRRYMCHYCLPTVCTLDRFCLSWLAAISRWRQRLVIRHFPLISVLPR